MSQKTMSAWVFALLCVLASSSWKLFPPNYENNYLAVFFVHSPHETYKSFKRVFYKKVLTVEYFAVNLYTCKVYKCVNS